jgi:uncharacterized membrane protein
VRATFPWLRATKNSIDRIQQVARDLPMVRDRIDREADAMQEAVDPQAMLQALERASETEPPKDQETTKPPTGGGHI